MKCNMRASVLVSAMLLAGAGVARADSAVFSCPNPDGSVELTGQPTGPNCEELLSAPAPTAVVPPERPVAGNSVQPPVDAAKASAGAPSGDPSAEATLESHLSSYRDAQVQQAAGTGPDGTPPTGPTSAASRRYLMLNRAQYQRALGINPQ